MVEYANAAAENLLKLSARSIVGHRIGEVFDDCQLAAAIETFFADPKAMRESSAERLAAYHRRVKQIRDPTADAERRRNSSGARFRLAVVLDEPALADPARAESLGRAALAEIGASPTPSSA